MITFISVVLLLLLYEKCVSDPPWYLSWDESVYIKSAVIFPMVLKLYVSLK